MLEQQGLINKTASVKVNETIKGKVLVIDQLSAKVEISLFGGHVLSYFNKVDGKERLWLSEKALFDQTSPIRGGIPLCWPWFANMHKTSNIALPSHGYLRTQNWQVCDLKESTSDKGVTETQLLWCPPLAMLFISKKA